MTALAVVNPFAPFLAAGAVLSGGKIYIGEPSKDPLSFPVPVYWDEALSIAALQPLRTSGGYIWRNGSPGRPYVDGDFSILVLDANDQQIFYSATSGGLLVSAFAKTLLDDADAAAMRVTLGIGSASEAGAGLVELSSDAEMRDGLSDTLAVSPKSLRNGLINRTTFTTTSGSTAEVTTIPPWATRIHFSFAQFSTTGTAAPLIQGRTASGYETSGYGGVTSIMPNGGATSGVAHGSGFVINSTLAANLINGRVTMERVDATNNWWAISGYLGVPGGPSSMVISGSKGFAAALTGVRVITTDAFDGGLVSISWE